MAELRWLTRYGPEGASSRYRAYQLASGLESSGWSCSFEPLARWGGSRLDLTRGVVRRVGRLSGYGMKRSAASALIIQKEPVVPPTLYRLVARRRMTRPVIWDIDDAVWIGRRGARRMSLDMCVRADVVVAGNHLLRDWASSHGAETVIIPTCYEPAAAVSLEAPVDGSTLNLVWIGSPATAPLLRPYAKLLGDLLVRMPDLRCRFIGGKAPDELRSNSHVRELAWSPTTEAEGLAWAHYGLALQSRSEYNDHKCGFKSIQYMSHGVIPIASDGPVHRHILDGQGLLVDETVEFDLVHDRLSQPPTRTERARTIARWRAEYSLEVAIAKWSQLLQRVVG